MPNLLVHDLRRSAVRNFDKNGVSQIVAMMISGHKTASVYKRYRIVPENDIRETLRKVEQAIEEQKKTPTRPLHDWKGRTMNPIIEPAHIPHNLHHSSATRYPHSTQSNMQLRDCSRDSWWARQDSNLGPTDYESAALTAELRAPRNVSP